MQKAYIGKQTNSICQLIPDTYDRFENYDENTFGDMYYMVIIPDGKHLQSHDYFYDPETQEFEKIKGITPQDHMSLQEPSRIKYLEEENRELKERLAIIEKKLGF